MRTSGNCATGSLNSAQWLCLEKWPDSKNQTMWLWNYIIWQKHSKLDRTPIKNLFTHPWTLPRRHCHCMHQQMKWCNSSCPTAPLSTPEEIRKMDSMGKLIFDYKFIRIHGEDNTYLAQENRRELINLRRKTCHCVHNNCPQISWRRYAANGQTIFLSFHCMLVKSRIHYVEVISAE